MNERTIADKESWLIKHGSLTPDPVEGGFLIHWMGKHRGQDRAAFGTTYWDGVEKMYENVKEGLWVRCENLLDKKS